MDTFKHRVKASPAYGVFLTTITWPGLMEQLAKHGYDFVIIDTEHGSYSYEQVQALAQRARLLGLHPIVRVTDKHYHLVARALDMGADSIMMPTVESAAEVEALARWAKYPPLGKRGAGSSAIVLDPDKARFIQETNDNGMLVIQIETKAGVENLDAILENPFLDAIFIGPLDLSVSLGFPGQFQHPLVAAAIEQVILKSCQAGKTVGLLCAPEQAAHFAGLGANLLAIGLDVTFLSSGARAAIAKAQA